MRKPLALVVAAALAACGGSSKNGGGGGGGGGTSVSATGTVAVTASASISAALTTACDFLGGGTSQGVSVLLVAASDVPNQCGLVQAGQSKANGKGILIAIVQADVASATPPPLGPGTYPISAQPQLKGTIETLAFSRVSADDGMCNEVAGEDATGGTITITSTANGRVQGSIDATVASGKITGTFDAPSCAVNLPTDFCTTQNPVPSRQACVP